MGEFILGGAATAWPLEARAAAHGADAFINSPNGDPGREWILTRAQCGKNTPFGITHFACRGAVTAEFGLVEDLLRLLTAGLLPIAAEARFDTMPS
jgi:hypothetical protein